MGENPKRGGIEAKHFKRYPKLPTETPTKHALPLRTCGDILQSPRGTRVEYVKRFLVSLEQPSTERTGFGAEWIRGVKNARDGHLNRGAGLTGHLTPVDIVPISLRNDILDRSMMQQLPLLFKVQRQRRDSRACGGLVDIIDGLTTVPGWGSTTLALGYGSLVLTDRYCAR
jgi:hypothetical protein